MDNLTPTSDLRKPIRVLQREVRDLQNNAGAVAGATDLSYTAATRVIASSTGADATLPLVADTEAGLAPASGGGTTNFLRADGTWTAPTGGLSQSQILARVSIGV